MCAEPWQLFSRPSGHSQNASISSAGPDTTHCDGPFTVARESVAGRIFLSSSSGIETASMMPGGMLCISCPRCATRARASSTVNTPARQAATYSPMLWPINAAGLIPQDIQRVASANSTAKSAGCVMRVCVSNLPHPSPCRPPDTALGAGPFRKLADRISAQRSISSLKTNSVRYRSAPMLTCCAP